MLNVVTQQCPTNLIASVLIRFLQLHGLIMFYTKNVFKLTDVQHKWRASQH